MRRVEKDRLIGAVRLSFGSGGIVAVRRRGERVILSGIFPGGIMTKAEAGRVGQLLQDACGTIPSDAPKMAGHWVSPPHFQSEAAE